MKFTVLTISLLSYAAAITAASEPVTFRAGNCIFNLYGYELTKPIQNAIVFGVGMIIDTYENTFGLPYPDNFFVRVTIIADKKEFLSYQKEHRGKVVSKTGYYHGAKRETVIWKNKSTKEMLRILFHEASHMILGRRIPWSPKWLNEGLAEYFGGLNVIGEKKRVNFNEYRHEKIKVWAKEGFPTEIDKYISLTHDQWMEFRKKNISAAYAMGHSLVYYMMSSSRTQQVLKKILRQIKKQGRDVDSIQAFNDNYPGGFKAFEKHWRSWIPRARKYRALRALKDKTKNPPQKDAANKK